ncbi:MAG: glycosyltransferase family 4 protein [Verrucomicrobiales bacterium]
MKVDLISVVPSPYQRDLFSALASEAPCDLRVHYLEDAAPDSPWPARSLAPYETVLPGWTAGRGRVRCHTNWALPNFADTDIAIVNAALTGVTTQQVIQKLCKRNLPWVFWGETLRSRTGLSGIVQQALTKRLHQASAIVAIGSVAQADYRRRFPKTPVYQLPYFCDLEAFAQAANGRETISSEPVFLFCGQMIRRKGIDVLLNAYQEAWRLGLRARLILVGREAELAPLLETLPKKVRQSIEFAGFQAPEALPAFFAKADVFVLPSRHDGWGVVVNQAIGAGLPIITTEAVGAAHDLVKPGINGIIVAAGETAPLADAMVKLGTDQALRATMSRRSLARSQQLTPVAGARAFLNILDSVLASESPLIA